MFKKINLIAAKPLLVLVVLYQKTLSPDHGVMRHNYPNGYCRFYPSCSSFAVQGLKKDGLISIPRTIYRVLRCQPWSLGGVDPYTTKY